MEIKTKQDLFKNFNKIFKVKVEETEKIIPDEELKGFLDESNVLMVIPKKESLKQYIKDNFEVEEKDTIQSIEYISKAGENCSSKFSCDYLKHILEICKHYESVVFKVREDYPLTIETDDFRFVLAPRVDND